MLGYVCGRWVGGRWLRLWISGAGALETLPSGARALECLLTYSRYVSRWWAALQTLQRMGEVCEDVVSWLHGRARARARTLP
ncbi:hypothetical protein BZA05DRAFT_41681 [Tricharina praecox]|uniref:uncharacterized protein n=1 Tax=Tricharina praecox TaxID=43433 RepID=UPI002220D912|nr:uncharacterized protein BZA05DRAFT_41681 [Tricharina praecox]KAI5852320.1 hypothetical protein BZA05DRAFT_41681 [Tricharina praecox]